MDAAAQQRAAGRDQRLGWTPVPADELTPARQPETQWQDSIRDHRLSGDAEAAYATAFSFLQRSHSAAAPNTISTGHERRFLAPPARRPTSGGLDPSRSLPAPELPPCGDLDGFMPPIFHQAPGFGVRSSSRLCRSPPPRRSTEDHFLSRLLARGGSGNGFVTPLTQGMLGMPGTNSRMGGSLNPISVDFDRLPPEGTLELNSFSAGSSPPRRVPPARRRSSFSFSWDGSLAFDLADLEGLPDMGQMSPLWTLANLTPPPLEPQQAEQAEEGSNSQDGLDRPHSQQRHPLPLSPSFQQSWPPQMPQIGTAVQEQDAAQQSPANDNFGGFVTSAADTSWPSAVSKMDGQQLEIRWPQLSIATSGAPGSARSDPACGSGSGCSNNSSPSKRKREATAVKPEHTRSAPPSPAKSRSRGSTRSRAAQQAAAAEPAADGATTSVFRGVSRHRLTNRWEASLWLKGRQLYLGGFNSETDAARAYDLVALSCKGLHVATNFDHSIYAVELAELADSSQEEIVAYVRRKSSAFTRGKSQYRGVSGHNGRWEARIGTFSGRKNVSFGVHKTEEDAARQYDRALIIVKGRLAKTNFPVADYDREIAAYEQELWRRCGAALGPAISAMACTYQLPASCEANKPTGEAGGGSSKPARRSNAATTLAEDLRAALSRSIPPQKKK